ncbi:hypothetical protein AVEN_210694-1 [Araneus ventricosus]|uniref:Uncharacterized protein n=1 Tax=Araneus ventricosus TaxID=182803 RepID=A0A4Y2FTN0_ARAVE|nr:hypothetical protein AVEN_210694-1 [Araneus ventricosus]
MIVGNCLESPDRMQKEKYEEWMSIDEDIPEAATLTDLEICQAIKIDDSDGDECVEENPPTNAEMRQALDILKCTCSIIQQILKNNTSTNNINELLRNNCRQATINEFF